VVVKKIWIKISTRRDPYQSMDLIQSSGNMETLTNLSDSTAAAGPRWVLPNRYGYNDVDDHSEASAKTTAASCTSSGRPFSISFTVATLPAGSSFHGDWIGMRRTGTG
jgi:hypothetical protein